MIKFRIISRLCGLLLVLVPGIVFASNALYFTGAKRIDSKHEYSFQDSFVYEANKIAETIHVYIEGVYDDSSSQAKEVYTFYGGRGKDIFTLNWNCSDDPWLNGQATCAQDESYSTLGVGGYYMRSYCSGYFEGHWCLDGRKLVPSAIVSLMRDGPPAPKVSGPSFTHMNPVQMALYYQAKIANRYYLNEVRCPPGNYNAPEYLPNGSVEPFGKDACKYTTEGPFKLFSAGTMVKFNEPTKNGSLYVRASLDSDSYGRGLWSHWQKTSVRLTPHFEDAPNNKPAPTILIPAAGYVLNVPNRQLVLKLKSNLKGQNSSPLSYDIEWQRQRYVTKDNVAAYNKLHKGNWPTPAGALEAMHPWSVDNNLPVNSNPVTLDSLQALSYQELRSHSIEFSYRYRIRARVNKSRWSPWRYFIVEENAGTSTEMRRGINNLEGLPSMPPKILAPTEGQVFSEPKGTQNHNINIKIHPEVANPKPDHWRYQLQWKRVVYYTKTNNDMYYCKYGQPGKNGFPRQIGVEPPLQVWDNISTPTSGWLDADDAVWEPLFSVFSPNSVMFSYQYQFRVREQRISPEAYSPWSPWRRFIVQNTGFNTCTARKRASIPNHIVGGIHVSALAKQQADKLSQQHANQHFPQKSKIRFGAKVMHPAAPRAGFSVVQQHTMAHNNVRFGGKVTNKLALQQHALAMHTLSGHLPAHTQAKHDVRTERYHTYQHSLAPQLKLLQHRETTARSCRNLGKLITIRQTLYNSGGPLATGQAQLFVQERDVAHLQSRHIRVPAMAHGATSQVTISVGTSVKYRSKLPRRHKLKIYLHVGNQTTTSSVSVTLAPHFCQSRTFALPAKSTLRMSPIHSHITPVHPLRVQPMERR